MYGNMSKRRIPLTHRKQRSVLTDMLPFEVPPTFSNRGFYRFLRDNEVEIVDNCLRWTADAAALDTTMIILFDIEAKKITEECVTEWGKSKTRKSVALKNCKMDTIPFIFNVAHNLDSRTLSIVHPRNQVQVANFYASYSALIIYYASVGEFSIRHPVSTSRFSFFKDKIHEEKLATLTGSVEEEDKEYEQLGSYFVYRRYNNIFYFFESYKYHQCEKKYDEMVQIDVNKCFDSIYTHSISWAVIGKLQSKFYLEKSKLTFAGQFDILMQRLNNKETNGIVIGPEFSRIFAEIILQSIDVELLKRLADTPNKLTHKIDYEVFRYVDDYFIFYNKPSTYKTFVKTLQQVLKSMKLSINDTKIKRYPKPIITELTIAKERVSSLMNSEIEPDIEEIPTTDPADAPTLDLVCDINTDRLILKYKTIIKETGVDYSSLLNYTFAIAEKKLRKILQLYTKSVPNERNQKQLLLGILAIVEFSFFTYSASPKVNHTIRICRMISVSVGFIKSNNFPYELKHILFKYVHDNIMQQLKKNTISIYQEVESLYLLISMAQIGREYFLPESTLTAYFQISINMDTASYERPQGFLSHFSITVLLLYIKTKKKYKKMREFIESHIIAKLKDKEAYCKHDAEVFILFLDLIICPYISDSTKRSLGDIFMLEPGDLKAVQSVNDQWFTAWDDKFNLGKELDAKRSREVY